MNNVSRLADLAFLWRKINISDIILSIDVRQFGMMILNKKHKLRGGYKRR